jgi:CelD/BcsL family acetyltransferase involved in cellulose biosynthesis
MQAGEALSVRDGGTASPAARVLSPVWERPSLPTADFIEVIHGSLPEAFGAADSGFVATVFQSPRWLRAWQDRLGEEMGFRPVTAVYHAGESPLFALPLALQRQFGVTVLTWAAHPQSDYACPVVNASRAGELRDIDGAAFLRRIAARIGGVDLIHVPKQVGTVAGIANPFMLPAAADYHAGAHAINFKPGESWPEALARRRSAKTRRRLKDKRTALERMGAVRFRVAATEADAEAMIRFCLDSKSDQLRRLGHYDPFSPNGVRDFLVGYFTGEVGRSAWAVSLELDDRIIASAFGFQEAGVWLLYQMAMTSGPESRHSPGTHLLMELMEHCIACGSQRLDLSLGDESYKSEWCDEHLVLKVSTEALTLRGRLLQLFLEARTRLQLKLSADPVLYDRAKRVKAIVRKLRLPA